MPSEPIPVGPQTILVDETPTTIPDVSESGVVAITWGISELPQNANAQGSFRAFIEWGANGVRDQSRLIDWQRGGRVNVIGNTASITCIRTGGTDEVTVNASVAFVPRAKGDLLVTPAHGQQLTLTAANIAASTKTLFDVPEGVTRLTSSAFGGTGTFAVTLEQADPVVLVTPTLPLDDVILPGECWKIGMAETGGVNPVTNAQVVCEISV